MKHSQDHLHRLIAAMSRAEKRYFKLYTSRHVLGDHSNHQVLFDAVSKMKTYDEEALLKKFKGEAFVRRFPIAKRRLYDMILKSLDAFHAESSIEAKLRRNMHQVEILFKKGLYKDASKILKSLRRQAVDNEMSTLLIDVKLWERKLMERTNYVDLKDGEIHEAAVEMKSVLGNIAQEASLWELKSELFEILYRKGQARSKEIESDLSALLNNEGLKTEPNTVKGKYLYFHTLGAHAYALGNHKLCQEKLQEQLDLLTANKSYFKEEPQIFLAVLSNLIHVTLALGEQEKADTLLARFNALPEELNLQSNEDLQLRVFATTASLELSMAMRSGNFSKTIAQMPEIEEGIIRFENRLGTVRKASLYYSIAYSYFAHGECSKSLLWINRLLSDVHIDKSENIVCFAHLLNLLIHVQQGRDQLLPYALRSTERFLKTRKRVYKFESVFLKMVKDIIKAKDSIQEEKTFLDFIANCRELRTLKLESPVFDRMHPEAWAKAFMSGSTIEEILKGKAKAA